jgi:predicted NBD/HSP70 family sugar kinase
MECLEKQSLLVHGANERAGELPNGSPSALIAFQCECGDKYCWETLSLSRVDYAAFRAANNGTPLLAARHDYALRRGCTQRLAPIVS